ncbi:MAG: hypothetical protein ACHQ1G_05995 [Planctomycetota bacterium]
MRVLALAALLAACAAPPPPTASVGPAASPSAPAPSSYLERLAERFRREKVSLGAWPVRGALPRPERCYDVAFLWEDHASDGWSYDLLVDPENPRVVWVRRTGTIVGNVRDYLGPAEIVDDSGPLVFRVRE